MIVAFEHSKCPKEAHGSHVQCFSVEPPLLAGYEGGYWWWQVEVQVEMIAQIARRLVFCEACPVHARPSGT